MAFKHQGDIPFTPFTGAITGTPFKHTGSVVLALGEQTGHKHVITVPNIDDMVAYKQPDGGWILELKNTGVVTHEEHGTIEIPAGTYLVGKEQEYDWFSKSTRKVID